MFRSVVLCAALWCLLVGSTAYASTQDLARELHLELIKVESTVLPDRTAAAMAINQPDLRTKKQEINRLVYEILFSKKFEDARVAYFATAYKPQELSEYLALVRSPLFKLYYGNSNELIQYSSVSVMPLLLMRLAQLHEQEIKVDQSAHLQNP